MSRYSSYSSNQTYEVFLADVIIGETIEMSGNSNLKAPPQRPGSNQLYDSVSGHTGGSKVYIVYKNVKTYPRYLIRYTL